jgi:hypothetical protein
MFFLLFLSFFHLPLVSSTVSSFFLVLCLHMCLCMYEYVRICMCESAVMYVNVCASASALTYRCYINIYIYTGREQNNRNTKKLCNRICLFWLHWKNFSWRHWIFFRLFTLCSARASALVIVLGVTPCERIGKWEATWTIYNARIYEFLFAKHIWLLVHI